ncbi:hypothetical protein BDW67DRAFT_123330 [Aspergillus spinulosporus]
MRHSSRATSVLVHLLGLEAILFTLALLSIDLKNRADDEYSSYYSNALLATDLTRSKAVFGCWNSYPLLSLCVLFLKGSACSSPAKTNARYHSDCSKTFRL